MTDFLKTILLIAAYALSVSCESTNIPKTICACYVFSPQWITSSYYIEIKDDGTLETTFGCAGDSISHFFENGSNKLKFDRNFFISDSVYVDNLYDSDISDWVESRGPQTKDTLISKEDLAKLTVFLNRLPNQSSKNIFALNLRDYNYRWYSAGIVLIKDTTHYMFWHDLCTKDEKMIYDIIKKCSPIKIDPDLHDREFISSEDDSRPKPIQNVKFINPEK